MAVQILDLLVNNPDQLLRLGDEGVEGEGPVFVHQLFQVGEQVQRLVVFQQKTPEVIVFLLENILFLSAPAILFFLPEKTQEPKHGEPHLPS